MHAKENTSISAKTFDKKISKNAACFSVCSDVLIFGLLNVAVVFKQFPIKLHNIPLNMF